MTLKYVDSFDHYVTADLTEKWTSLAASPAVNASAGRRGGGGLNCPNGTSVTTNILKTLDAQGTWIIGFAFKTSLLSGVTARSLCTLLDLGTAQVCVRLNADGTLSAMRGNSSGTVLGTTAFALSIGSFYYIEIKVVIHDTTGTFEIKVDGGSKLALTGQDTKSTANATANAVQLGTDGSATISVTHTYDDLYICDGAGSVNNSFLGDCRVDYYAPNGNGNSSQLDGSDGNQVDNYLLVDDTTPDDDTTYVQSADVGDKDTYTCADMTHTPSSIFGIQVLANAKKDDAGARSLKTVTRSGTTDFDGATQALSTSYLYYSDIREVDPNTSAAWTKANLNAAEHGVGVAA